MTLVSSFTSLWQEISFVMTQPTFPSFATLLTGWVSARRVDEVCESSSRSPSGREPLIESMLPAIEIPGYQRAPSGRVNRMAFHFETQT